MLGTDDLFGAVKDAVSVIQEHADRPLGDRLAYFGVDAEALVVVAEERWASYASEHGDAHRKELFMRAWVEGILTGVKLPKARP